MSTRECHKALLHPARVPFRHWLASIPNGYLPLPMHRSHVLLPPPGPGPQTGSSNPEKCCGGTRSIQLNWFSSPAVDCNGSRKMLSSSPRALNVSYLPWRKRPDPWSMGSQKLDYQCKRPKQTSSMPLRSVPPATARPFAAAPETFPVIAATAKEKSWFNSHRGCAPRVAVQVRGEHWVRLNIVRFVPEEVGKIQKSSRHSPRLN